MTHNLYRNSIALGYFYLQFVHGDSAHSQLFSFDFFWEQSIDDIFSRMKNSFGTKY